MRFRILMMALLGLIVALPLESSHLKSMLALFGGIIPLSAGSMGQKGRFVPVMAVITLVVSIHELAGFNLLPAWSSYGILCLYFWSSSALVLRQVFEHRLATAELLCGALSCYLLLGLGWTAAFGLLEHRAPGSLRSPHELNSCSFLYFTFVTLLTIGYGDIVPESPTAQIMTVLTGLSGMVFTTVVLASLVSLRTTAPPGDKT